MSAMNVSLPESLKTFVDEQVAERGCITSSEYVRELIRREQERQRLRAMLLEGVESGPGVAADQSCFEGLRERLRTPAQVSGKSPSKVSTQARCRS
jgi:antitoxin ParD1/3/4